MSVALVPAELELVRHVARNMREADREEIYATRFDEDPDALATDVAAVVCTNSRRVQDPAGDAVLIAKEKPGPTPPAIETRPSDAAAKATPLGNREQRPDEGLGPWPCGRAERQRENRGSR